jgi:hypothetical protein
MYLLELDKQVTIILCNMDFLKRYNQIKISYAHTYIKFSRTNQW